MSDTNTPPGRAYGYIRASTEDQETTLVSQEDAIIQEFEKVYEPQGYQWGGFFIDKITGSVPLDEREAGYKLCCTVERGDLVIMQKIDRGWRNVADFAKTLEIWIKNGVRIALLTQRIDTGTIGGIAFAQMLAVFAEFERGMISERVKHWYNTRKSLGMPAARCPPYGYKIVRRESDGKREFQPYPEVRAIGKKIVKWFDQGWTIDEIYRHMVESGIVHPDTGLPLGRTTIHTWARRERLMQQLEKGRWGIANPYIMASTYSKP